MTFTRYQSYIWVYVLGTVVTLANTMVFHNQVVEQVCLAVLYCILFYKGIHILRCYKRTQSKAQPLERQDFIATYKPFRFRVACFWLAFVGLCLVAKFALQLQYQYFYGCTYFFLFLDRWFVNAVCWLQKLSDPKGTIVVCCCGCPCRGWDLMMIHTPLLFALHLQGLVENMLIVLSSVVAMVTMVCWEKGKYHLVEIREKCAKSCDLALCKEHLG